MTTLPVTINNLNGTETLVEDCHRSDGPPIPKGTTSDGASVPWILRRFWPSWGSWYDRAAFGHDWRYQRQEITRKAADEELKRNMTLDAQWYVSKVRGNFTRAFAKPWTTITCTVFYIAVRGFGGSRWRRCKKEKDSKS